AVCDHCGRNVRIRVNGCARLHTYRDEVCPGSETQMAEYGQSTTRADCDRCGRNVRIHVDGYAQLHLGREMVCPGSGAQIGAPMTERERRLGRLHPYPRSLPR